MALSQEAGKSSADGQNCAILHGAVVLRSVNALVAQNDGSIRYSLPTGFASEDSAHSAFFVFFFMAGGCFQGNIRTVRPTGIIHCTGRFSHKGIAPCDRAAKVQVLQAKALGPSSLELAILPGYCSNFRTGALRQSRTTRLQQASPATRQLNQAKIKLQKAPGRHKFLGNSSLKL